MVDLVGLAQLLAHRLQEQLAVGVTARLLVGQQIPVMEAELTAGLCHALDLLEGLDLWLLDTLVAKQ
jgi:hypothetical protein